MVHYCSTESQCKDYKEKPGSCGSAAVPLLEIASKEKKTRHCKSCREANLGDHLLEYQGKFGSGRWTCTNKNCAKQSTADEVVYLEIQFLPLLFALQLKCNY